MSFPTKQVEEALAHFVHAAPYREVKDKEVLVTCYHTIGSVAFVAGYQLPSTNQIVICGLDFRTPYSVNAMHRCVATFMANLRRHIGVLHISTVKVAIDESFSVTLAYEIDGMFRQESTTEHPVEILCYNKSGVLMKKDKNDPNQPMDGIYMSDRVTRDGFTALIHRVLANRIVFHEDCVSSEKVITLKEIKAGLEDQIRTIVQAGVSSLDTSLQTLFEPKNERDSCQDIYLSFLLFMYCIRPQ